MMEKFKNNRTTLTTIFAILFYYASSRFLVPWTGLHEWFASPDKPTEYDLAITAVAILFTVAAGYILPVAVSILDSFYIFFSTPIFKKRWRKFTSMKRGYYSFIIIITLYFVSFFSEFLINGRAILVKYQGSVQFTLFSFTRAKDFGMKGYGLPNYREMKVFYANQEAERQKRIASGTPTEEDVKYQKEWGNDWVLLPPYPFGPVESLLDELPGRPPHPPTWMPDSWRINYWDEDWYEHPDKVPDKYRTGKWAGIADLDIYKEMALNGELSLKKGIVPPGGFSHLLGTDDRGRDVFARMVYGFRISISFALLVTFICYSIGMSIGAFLGYYGGTFDIVVQRFVEIWSAMPFLYTVMIIAAIMEPSFLLLAFILCLFGWMGMTYYIRGEFYREKSKDYVSAATAIGCTDGTIIFKHILPNSLTPVISSMPFAIVGNIGSLVSLDFLGFGLPAPTPSWGELLGQGLANLTKPWLALSPMLAMFLTLLLVSFIGEAIREAFDPKEYSRLR